MATKTPNTKKPAPRAGNPRGTKKAAQAKKPAPKPRGRPTIYAPALAQAYLNLLLEPHPTLPDTTHSLRSASDVPGMPSTSTVMRWLAEDAGNGDFRARYARAREAQGELEAQAIIDIADAPARTITVEWTDPKNKTRRVPVLVAVDANEVAMRRLRIDARKWSAAHKHARVWGDKLQLDATEDMMVVVKDLTGRKGERPAEQT